MIKYSQGKTKNKRHHLSDDERKIFMKIEFKQKILIALFSLFTILVIIAFCRNSSISKAVFGHDGAASNPNVIVIDTNNDENKSDGENNNGIIVITSNSN